MYNIKEEIFTLKMEGYCCSQIIMEIGLRRLDITNPQLIDAMGGLCDGAKCGSLCGAVSAAVCLLYLADAREAENGLAEEYTEWFQESFGALDCSELLAEGPMAKLEKCPMIVEATVQKLAELLEWE